VNGMLKDLQQHSSTKNNFPLLPDILVKSIFLNTTNERQIKVWLNFITFIVHYELYFFIILDRRSSLERQSTLYRPTYYEEYYDNGDQFEPYDNKQ